MEYYLWINGEECGPFSLGQIREMWNTGATTTDTPYWCEGLAGWKPIQELFESAQDLEDPAIPTAPSFPAASVRDSVGKNSLLLKRIAVVILALVAIAWGIHAWHGKVYSPAERAAVEEFKAQLKANPDIVLQNDENDDSPLHKAADDGHDGIAEVLLAHGADVNAKDRFGWTPLLIAAGEGHDAVAEVLLSHGADVNAKDQDEKTPLLIAADKGYEAMVRLLLAHGADVNAKDKLGDTALHKAADKGYETIAEVLLSHGAEVNAKDYVGFMPLHIASDKGYEAMVKVLVAHGADVNAKNQDGQTPLLIAADSMSGDYDAVAEVLLAHGADVNAKDKDGETAFYYAVGYHHKNITELLRGHGGHD